MLQTAIILAGGLGTRLRSVVSGVPKPMAPVKGKPFLEHLLDYWIGQGIKDFVVSVGYKHEAITEYFGSSYNGANLRFSKEDKPLGTGGALLLAINSLAITGPALVLNGDTFFAVDLQKFFEFHNLRHSSFTLSLFRTYNSDRYLGVAIDSDGLITSLDGASSTPAQLVNGGVYLCDCDMFAELGKKHEQKMSLEKDLLRAVLDSGHRIYGKEAFGNFIDIGIPSDYHRSASILP